MSSNANFVGAVQLSDRMLDERYDLDLVLRFLVLHNRPQEKLTLSFLRDFNQVLDDESIEMAKKFPSNRVEMENTFDRTFGCIIANGAEDVFRKWDPDRTEFRGSFLNTAFEVFALGVGYHVANGSAFQEDVIHVVKRFWELPEMRRGFATGRSTESRLRQFVPLGRELLAG